VNRASGFVYSAAAGPGSAPSAYVYPHYDSALVGKFHPDTLVMSEAKFAAVSAVRDGI
jgi:hypothetical protein